MASVDLRPMSLGEVLDRTFTLYREHFLLFVGIAALPDLVMLLFRFCALLFTKGAMTANGNTLPTVGFMGGFVVSILGAGILMLVLLGVSQAATITAVSSLFLGRDISVAESYSGAKGHIAGVIVIMILSGLATMIGFIFLIIPGIYIACRLAVSVPVSVVENESPVASMERSTELTKDYAGQVFLLLLLVVVLSYVVAIMLQFPVMFFAISAAMAKHQVSTGVTVYSYLAEFVSQVLVGPIGTISAALMYYNLRVRKEGFDIQHLMNSLGNVPRPLADYPAVR